MAQIVLHSFRGETPKPTRFFRDPRTAEQAVDCDVRSGALRPLFLPTHVASVGLAHRGLVALPGGARFIGLDEPTVQVNARQRSYFLAGGKIRYARGSDASETFELGVPRPTKALTVSAAAGSSADRTTRSFLYTLVNRDGEESDPSEVVTAEDTSDATFTVSVPAYTAQEIEDLFGEKDGSGSLKVRVYVGFTLQARFIEERGFAAGSGFNATYKEGATTLGEVIDVPEHLTLPPDNVTSLAVLRGNFLAAAAEDTLYFSEPNVHNKWPAGYNRKTTTDILSIVPWVDLLYVFPRDAPPVVVTVPTPDVYSAYDTQIPWPCLSGPSAVNTGLGVVYAAKSGMVALNGSSGSLATKEIFDSQSFAPFNPSRIRAFAIDGVYQGYGNGRPFTLDTQAMGGMELTERTWNPTDVRVVDSEAYGLREGNVWRHSEQGLRREFRWKSNLWRLPKPQTLTKVQVRADFDPPETTGPHVLSAGIGTRALGSEPVALHDLALAEAETNRGSVFVTLYNEDGRKVSNTRVVNDAEPKALSMDKNEDNFCVEVISSTTVHSVVVAESGDDTSLGTVVS